MKYDMKACISGFALAILTALIAAASASIITVDDDLIECPSANFTSIQAAIDNASAGDTILVYPGYYRENIAIDKTLNLTGIGKPTIDGMQKQNTVVIAANECVLSGFEIINGSYLGAGLAVSWQNNLITHNDIHSNMWYGILVTSNNTIAHNNIFSNRYYGIAVVSDNNIISHNNISHNSNGIDISNCEGNLVQYNNISKNGVGIYLSFSNNNIIRFNKVLENHNGIYIYYSSEINEIVGNNITNNDNKGVSVKYTSNNNILYHNNFMENNPNAYDVCNNQWYNSSLKEGNYYDDYNGTDADEDGIGDVPYNISGGMNKDLYPLMEPYVENEPPVADFTFSPEFPFVNETVIFNASLSFDPDGRIVSYEWDFGDGMNGTGEIVNHSYSEAGNYTVMLTVTDERGAKNSTMKVVCVREEAKPEVRISTDKYEYRAGDMMTVNITVENPKDEREHVIFLFQLKIIDFNKSFNIINRSLILPPKLNKTKTLQFNLPNLSISFNASWYVAMFNASTSEMISEDEAEWMFVAKAEERMTPEEIVKEMTLMSASAE